MKKRLRKKLRVKEFTEYGFEIKIIFKEELSDEQEDKFTTRFFIDIIEKNGCGYYGGMLRTEFNGVIADRSIGQNPKAKQQLIKELLEKDSLVQTVIIGKIVDIKNENAFED